MPFNRIALPAFALLAACNPQADAVAQNENTATSGPKPFKVTQVADFVSPWAMTFLPDGQMLVTEKAGQLLLVSADGKTQATVSGIPPVSSGGQGALMDVVLHPEFAENHWAYFSYSQARSDGLKGVVLARGKLAQGASPSLTDVQTLFRADPYVSGNGHFSGRIAFAADGHLFFTHGERQKMDPAQDPKTTLGKVLRLTGEGKPAGDPGLTAKGFRPEVWSYGHRNLLGLAFDAQGNLWEQEMGPMGGDEVNLIRPGANYGWPKVSNGTHYDGRDIPDHKAGDGYEAPKIWWNSSISPGGLMVYSGKLFPAWKGDLFLGGLSGKALIRIDLSGTDASKGDQWDMGARIREVEQGPDGAIWVLEDGGESEGRLLKLTPL